MKQYTGNLEHAAEMIALGPKYRLENFVHLLFSQGGCQKVQNFAFQARSFETKQHIVYLKQTCRGRIGRVSSVSSVS